MADDRPTAAELQQLLAHLLAGAVGGDEAAWSAAIGAVKVHPLTFRPRCNWSVDPTGSAEQLDAIEKAVGLVSAEHPYARAG